MARTMTPRLEAFFRSLTAADRRVLVQLTCEADSDLLFRLLDAVAAECIKDAAHETTLLHQLEMDHMADLEDVERRVHGEHPPVEGRAAEIDPETGRILPE